MIQKPIPISCWPLSLRKACPH